MSSPNDHPPPAAQAPRIQLPDGAIAVRAQAADDSAAQAAAWTEIELHTPTADQAIPIRAAVFTPAPGIPEDATTFAAVLSSSVHGDQGPHSSDGVVTSKSISPVGANLEPSEMPGSSPPPPAVQSTPPSCLTGVGTADLTSNALPSHPPRIGLFRESSLGTILLSRDSENAMLSRDIEASTCRIPLNPFDHDSQQQHKTFPSPLPPPQETQSFANTVTRHTRHGDIGPMTSTEFTAMMRTRTFSPSWKKSRPLKSGWGAASLEATSSIPPAHPSTTTQTSLLDGVPSLDTAECQLEEGVSARDVKLGMSGLESRGALDEEEDLGQTKGLKAALCSFLSGLHPLYLMYLSRALFTIPLSLLFLVLALANPDWRHVQLSYMVDHKVNSKTIIGLSAIERSTETQSSVLPAAATVRELPLSFKHVLSHNADDKYCDPLSQTTAAQKAIGDLTVKEALEADAVAGPDSQRARKLALYHLIHGPTFRDVDCRHIRSFRVAGLIAKCLISIVMVLILGEWWIISFTLLTKKRSREAKAALHWCLLQRRSKRNQRHTRAETDPGQYLDASPSPPFVWPKRPALSLGTGDQDISSNWHREPSWAMIDLRRQGQEAPKSQHGRRRIRDGFVFGRVRQSLKKVRSSRLSDRMKRGSRKSIVASCRRRRRNVSGGRVCLLGRRRITHLKFTRPSDRLWWRPLRKVESCCHWSPDGSYFAASVLGGSTLLLALVETILVTLAALVWITKTSKPACLNEGTELNTCERGQGLSYLFAGVTLTWIAMYCHLKTPSVCAKMLQTKLSSSNYR